MKANELRIGNLVNTNRAHGKGEKQINIVKINLHYLGQLKNNCKYIEPIPLNEEWLLKFGFKEVIANSWYSKLAKNKNTINISLSGLVAINEEKPIRAIEHVHQLQNLYFALTNEEL